MRRACDVALWYLHEHIRLAWQSRKAPEDREREQRVERVRTWCRLQRAKGNEPFTPRDFVRGSCRHFRKRGGTTEAKEILLLLVKDGFLEELPPEGKGGPRYRIRDAPPEVVAESGGGDLSPLSHAFAGRAPSVETGTGVVDRG